MTPRGWIILGLAVIACVCAVFGFIEIADKNATTDTAGFLLAGGIFAGGLGLGLSTVP